MLGFARHLRILGAGGLALALALAAAGCAPEVRRVETHLGANARIVVDGKRVARDPKGMIEIPLGAEKQVIRVEEPRKPAIVEEVHVLVDPRAEVEDAIVLASTANTTVVYTGEKGGSIAGRTAPVALFPDPLQLLRDPLGPYLGPAKGQGVILVASDAGANAYVGDAKVPLRPSRADGTGPSLPEVVEVAPGEHAVRVEKIGAKPYEARAVVRAGEYTLLAVRLADATEEEEAAPHE